ncbi:MAG: hypothetical protein ACR2NP_20000 [Pirellulaceae bacterium]
MTLLPGRTIALLLTIAVALAGTPNQIAANDGLNTSRFSVRSADDDSGTVRSLVPPASTDNPLRGRTVSATISGDVRVASRDTRPTNFAAIISSRDTIDVVENRRGRQVANGTSQIAMEWSTWNELVNEALGNSIVRLTDGIQWLDHQTPARQRIRATNAGHRSKTGKSRATIRPYKTPAASEQRRAPQTQTLRKLPAGNMSVFVVEDGFPAAERSLIEREIFDDVICMIGCEEDSRRTPTRNGKPFGFGEDLLIDQFLPNSSDATARQSSDRPSRLAVPAMTIGHRKATQTVTLSNQSLILTAKAVIRSIVKVIRPLALLERVVRLHQRVESAVIDLDELIWSAELNHIWNTCGMYE